MKPEPGAPHYMNDETRVCAVEGRGKRFYSVECNFGFNDWQVHCAGPSETFAQAVELARRVAYRERAERPEQYVESDVEDQSDSHAMRIPMYPEAAVASPDPPHLSDRIMRGRRRVGWR